MKKYILALAFLMQATVLPTAPAHDQESWQKLLAFEIYLNNLELLAHEECDPDSQRNRQIRRLDLSGHYRSLVSTCGSSNTGSNVVKSFAPDAPESEHDKRVSAALDKCHQVRGLLFNKLGQCPE